MSLSLLLSSSQRRVMAKGPCCRRFIVVNQQQQPQVAKRTLLPRTAETRTTRLLSSLTQNDHANKDETTPLSLYMWGTDESKTGSTTILKNEADVTTTVFDFPTKVDYASVIQKKIFSGSLPIGSVHCGPSDTAFLLQDGTCWVMGMNKMGQLGVGHSKPVTQPTCIQLEQTGDDSSRGSSSKISQVSLGSNFCAFVEAETGDLYTSGFGGSSLSGIGWLGHGTNTETQLWPKRVESLVQDGCRVKQVQVSESHMTVLTTEGEVLTTGTASYGRLGNYDTSVDQLYLEPVEMLTPEDHVIQIAGGKSFTLALTGRSSGGNEGVIYSWGRNHKGQLGSGLGLAVDIYAMQAVPEPIMADELQNRKIVQIAAGHSHAACLSNKGEVFYWGMQQYFEPVLCNELLHTRIVQIACGEDYTLALDEEGRLYSWGVAQKTFGRNNGVLGQGSKQTRLVRATQIDTFVGDSSNETEPEQRAMVVKQISAGWKHAACLAQKQKVKK